MQYNKVQCNKEVKVKKQRLKSQTYSHRYVVQSTLVSDSFVLSCLPSHSSLQIILARVRSFLTLWRLRLSYQNIQRIDHHKWDCTRWGLMVQDWVGSLRVTRKWRSFPLRSPPTAPLPAESLTMQCLSTYCNTFFSKWGIMFSALKRNLFDGFPPSFKALLSGTWFFL